jgi:hypothetical protein
LRKRVLRHLVERRLGLGVELSQYGRFLQPRSQIPNRFDV